MPSRLSIINTLIPKDGGSRRVARGIAYGPHPRNALDIYAPTGAVSDCPVVMFIHGGGWESGDREEYEFAGRALAAKGFVTVLPSYRLAPQSPFPDFVADCAEALSFVKREIASYGGDPARIGLMGHSAGAYIAVMLALDPGSRKSVQPKCVVGLSGPYDFYPFNVHASMQAFGAAPDPLKTQPVHLPLSGAPPMLFIHGTGDTSVAPANSRTLAAKLLAAGREAELIEYEGADHFITLGGLMTLLRWRVPVLADSVRFLSSHLIR